MKLHKILGQNERTRKFSKPKNEKIKSQKRERKKKKKKKGTNTHTCKLKLHQISGTKKQCRRNDKD